MPYPVCKRFFPSRNFFSNSYLEAYLLFFIMFRLLAASNFGKALNSIARPAVMAAASRPPAKVHNRFLVYTASHNKKIAFKKDPSMNVTAKYLENVSGQHEGQFAWTDENVHTQHPPNSEMLPQSIVQDRGGMHFNRTLAHFSPEEKVSMVTGGAR